MRIRFFITISAVLFIVSISVLVIHAVFLQREKMSLIDQQVRQTASALVDSALSDIRRLDFDKADDIISEELGESSIGKFFVVRNAKNDIIYQSASVNLLPLKEIPEEPQWITLRTHENFIRVLNLKLPSVPDRTLQVGVMFNDDLISPEYFSKSSLVLIFSVLTVGSIASFFLTSFLLKPIENLGRFISAAIDKLQSQDVLEPIPANMTSDFGPSRNDEYTRLVNELNLLIDKMNKFYRTSRLWAYQMAHELKTPLSIIRLDIEKLQKKIPAQDSQIESIEHELEASSHVIHSFLSWAELENSKSGQNLFAQKLSGIVRAHIKRLDPEHSRIRTEVENEITVVCNPAHLDQLLVNLISNALQYSQRNVSIRISDNQLIIRDSGAGIPKEILDRLGEPFNKGSEKQGTGLGLAWVKSICNLYDWKFDVESSPDGTRFQIGFTV